MITINTKVTLNAENRRKMLNEVRTNYFDNYQIGKYLYLAIGIVNDHKVVLGIGYRIDYCLKKAVQFMQNDDNVVLQYINKVKVGELHSCDKFYFGFDLDEVINYSNNTSKIDDN